MSTATESVTLRVQAEQIADAYLPNGGRPALTADPDKVQLFLACIRDGNYRETAYKQAGIAKQTFYNTLKRAEQGDVAAQAFVDAVEKAEADAEADTVRNVRNASKSPQFWAAGMTWLERKSPDRWGRRQDDANVPRVVVQIGVKDGDVQVNLGVNHNAPYQNQTESESQSGQALTSTPPETFGGESEGRKLLEQAKVTRSVEPALTVQVGPSLEAILGAGIPRGTLPGARAANGRKEKPLQRALAATRKQKKKGAHVAKTARRVAAGITEGAKTPR